MLSHQYCSRLLTYEFWCTDHHFRFGVNGEILCRAKIDDLQLLCAAVLQHYVLWLQDDTQYGV